MTLSQGPYQWSSAHRPIEFTFTYESKTISSVTNDGGYAKINLILPYTTITPVVGERLIIAGTTSGAYDGTWKILTVNSTTSFTVDKAYSTASLVGSAKHIYLPEVILYAGYDTGEGYDDELPLQTVATFTPKNSPDNNVQIDVSGFLKTIFTVTAPVVAGAIDFTVWNKFKLYFQGAYSDNYYVLNSAIDSDVLNKYYVKTGRYLISYDKYLTGTPENYNYLQDCGITVLYRVQGDHVAKYIITDGDTTAADYDTDFTTDFA